MTPSAHSAAPRGLLPGFRRLHLTDPPVACTTAGHLRYQAVEEGRVLPVEVELVVRSHRRHRPPRRYPRCRRPARPGGNLPHHGTGPRSPGLLGTNPAGNGKTADAHHPWTQLPDAPPGPMKKAACKPLSTRIRCHISRGTAPRKKGGHKPPFRAYFPRLELVDGVGVEPTASAVSPFPNIILYVRAAS